MTRTPDKSIPGQDYNLMRASGFAVFVVVTGVVAAYFSSLYFNVYGLDALVRADSASYLDWAFMRPPAYPLLLQGLIQIGAFPAILPSLQLAVLICALAAFVWSAARVTGLWLVVLVVAIVALGHAAFTMQALFVLTEAFLCAAILIFCASAAWCVHHASWQAWAMLGAATGLAIALKPSGMFLLAGVLWLFVVCWRGLSWRQPVALVVAAGIMIAGASMISQQRHGERTLQAMGGLSLLGHVAWAIEPTSEGEYATLKTKIAQDVAPIVAARPDPLPYPAVYRVVTSAEYNLLLWDTVFPDLEFWLFGPQEDEPGVRDAAYWADIDALARKLALETVEANRVAYARHVAAHYLGLVRMAFSNGKSYAKRLSDALDTSREEVQTNAERYANGIEARPGSAIYEVELGVNWLSLGDVVWRYLNNFWNVWVNLFFIISALCVVWSPFTQRPTIRYLSVLAMSVHAYLFATALVQVALPRYVMVWMPVVLFLTFVGWAVVLRALFMRRRVVKR